MAERMLSDEICVSSAIGALSERAEMIFLRIHVKACPLGRFYASPEIVKAQALTNRPRIRVTDVASALEEIERAGLIVRYASPAPECEPLLAIRKYGQRFTKQARSPFAAPPHGAVDAPGQRLLFLEASVPEDDPPGERATSPIEGKKEGNTPQPPAAQGAPFSTPEFLAAWEDWKRHRTEIRKPLRPTGEKAALAALATLGELRAITAIRHSIAQGWQGIYEPKNNPTFANHANTRRSFEQRNDYSGTGF